MTRRCHDRSDWEGDADKTLTYGAKLDTLLFLNKNHVYKNVEAQIAKKLKTSQEHCPALVQSKMKNIRASVFLSKNIHIWSFFIP